MTEHGEFRFDGYMQPDGSVTPTPAPAATFKTAVGTPVNVAAPIMEAARLAHLIKSSPVPEWKAALEAIEDEDVRARCRTMLEREYRERQAKAKLDAERIRRETVGKKSSAGDEAIAALAKRFG